MKILYIAPHLSTGGAPQFLLKQIEEMMGHDIWCIEYADITKGAYVVQSDKIKALLGNRFTTLPDSDKMPLTGLIDAVKPDVVHLIEIPELFIDEDIAEWIYRKDRLYSLYESSHTISFNPRDKKWLPDKFFLVSDYQIEQYALIDRPKVLLDYPIEPKVRPDRDSGLKALGLDPSRKHLLNVGLFTRGKNQGYIFELARRMPDIDFHFVGNQASNFIDYWQPLMSNKPSNCYVYGERADVDKFYGALDAFIFTSTYECMPLAVKEAISWDMPVFMYDLPVYKKYFDRFNVHYLGLDDSTMIREVLEREYEIRDTNAFEFTFVGGARVDIVGDHQDTYKVSFVKDGEEVYVDSIPNGSWTKCFFGYVANWEITVTNSNGGVVARHKYNPTGKLVNIHIGSSSLGDMLAWVPYVEEYRKAHGCDVICSIPNTELFKDKYPKVLFVPPGTPVNKLYAQFEVGWSYDGDVVNRFKSPIDFKAEPMQKTASAILGLPYREIRPLVAYQEAPRSIEDKYVCIATHSTLQSKYWNNPTGWQEVIDWLNSKGYKVVYISREPIQGLTGIIDKSGNLSLQERMNDLKHAEFFIGLGSGLSWLAWAMETPVVLISGFSEEWTEFDCYRVINKSVCHGCFNRCTMDKANWNWCPDYAGTDRQFECTKEISSEQVIDTIKELIQHETDYK